MPCHPRLLGCVSIDVLSVGRYNSSHYMEGWLHGMLHEKGATMKQEICTSIWSAVLQTLYITYT